MTNRIDARMDEARTGNTPVEEAQCPECQQTFLDLDAVQHHAQAEHQLTRQQFEQQEADDVIDRQQDMAGRRETAGQPRGDEDAPGKQGRNLQQQNAAQAGDDLHQQTQQQQPQTPSASQDAAIDRKED